MAPAQGSAAGTRRETETRPVPVLPFEIRICLSMVSHELHGEIPTTAQPGESNGAGHPVGLGLLAEDGHAEGIIGPA